MVLFSSLVSKSVLGHLLDKALLKIHLGQYMIAFSNYMFIL